MDERVAIPSRLPWATRSLARLGMSSNEIENVLLVEEPSLLRRYFELHEERLNEVLTDQLRLLADVERVLAFEMLRHPPRSADGS